MVNVMQKPYNDGIVLLLKLATSHVYLFMVITMGYILKIEIHAGEIARNR